MSSKLWRKLVSEPWINMTHFLLKEKNTLARFTGAFLQLFFRCRHEAFCPKHVYLSGAAGWSRFYRRIVRKIGWDMLTKFSAFEDQGKTQHRWDLQEPQGRLQWELEKTLSYTSTNQSSCSLLYMFMSVQTLKEVNKKVKGRYFWRNGNYKYINMYDSSE